MLDGKIIQFEPGHPGAAKSWPLPQQLLDGVTALASDGEDVRLTSPPGIRSVSPGNMHRFGRPNLGFDRRGFVAVMRAADSRWRGGFELPVTVAASPSHETRFMPTSKQRRVRFWRSTNVPPCPASPHDKPPPRKTARARIWQALRRVVPAILLMPLAQGKVLHADGVTTVTLKVSSGGDDHAASVTALHVFGGAPLRFVQRWKPRWGRA